MFYATSTLGKPSPAATRHGVFPRRLYLGDDLGRAAAVSKSAAIARAMHVRLRGIPLGDLAKPPVHPVFRVSRRLGDVTCRIDPVTGGRVCSNDPTTTTSATATNFIGPMIPVSYPDGTLIKGSGDPVSLISGGMRRWIPDPATFNAMGFSWGAIQTVSDAVYNSIPAGPQFPSVTQNQPVPLPVTPAATALPATIQPTATAAALPTTFVSSSPAPMPMSGGGSSNLGTYLMWGGLSIGGLLVLKMTGIIGKK
ncbi:MAG: hypothetical protein LAP21_15220 [Acidobacteriia bacterium]|nr:hypothetical protein [Terriglobia bacterium]